MIQITETLWVNPACVESVSTLDNGLTVNLGMVSGHINSVSRTTVGEVCAALED